jgi:hypothetical protein
MPYIFKNHSWSLSDNSWSMIDTVSSVVGEHLVSVMTSTTMRRPFTRGGADCSTRLSMLYYWISLDSLKSHVSRRHPLSL